MTLALYMDHNVVRAVTEGWCLICYSLSPEEIQSQPIWLPL